MSRTARPFRSALLRRSGLVAAGVMLASFGCSCSSSSDVATPDGTTSPAASLAGTTVKPKTDPAKACPALEAFQWSMLKADEALINNSDRSGLDADQIAKGKTLWLTAPELGPAVAGISADLTTKLKLPVDSHAKGTTKPAYSDAVTKARRQLDLVRNTTCKGR